MSLTATPGMDLTTCLYIVTDSSLDHMMSLLSEEVMPDQKHVLGQLALEPGRFS